MIAEKEKLIEPGSHSLLVVYNNPKAFHEIYSQYSMALLPENEIIVGRNSTIDNIKRTFYD
jgi:hypothetical protein